jgi:hypothetical protein
MNDLEHRTMRGDALPHQRVRRGLLAESDYSDKGFYIGQAEVSSIYS